MENPTKYFVDTIRELERQNTELELQNRVLRARLGFLEDHTEDVEPVQEPEQLESGEVAGDRMIIEGVAYESRNFRQHHRNTKFKHFPEVQVAVFKSDRKAKAYREERRNSSYIHRLGSCLIELDRQVPHFGRTSSK